MSPRPHYLPAALIGGFGVPASGVRASKLRHAKVIVRRRDKPDELLGPMAAANVAVDTDVYRVDHPDRDLPADFAEELWVQYESALPGAVGAVESGTFTRQD